MKKLLCMLALLLALCCAALFLGAAEQNLLSPKFSIYGKKNANAETVTRENGQIDCSIKDAKDKKTAAGERLFRSPAALQ